MYSQVKKLQTIAGIIKEEDDLDLSYNPLNRLAYVKDNMWLSGKNLEDLNRMIQDALLKKKRESNDKGKEDLEKTVKYFLEIVEIGLSNYDDSFYGEEFDGDDAMMEIEDVNININGEAVTFKKVYEKLEDLSPELSDDILDYYFGAAAEYYYRPEEEEGYN